MYFTLPNIRLGKHMSVYIALWFENHSGKLPYDQSSHFYYQNSLYWDCKKNEEGGIIK